MLCIRLFARRSDGAREHALNLGIAPQLTHGTRELLADAISNALRATASTAAEP